MTASQLDQLKEMTTVVSDTGDIDAIAEFKPQDATTNPSLILEAIQKPQYAYLMDNAINYGKQPGKQSIEETAELVLDRLLINFGSKILEIVPGRVSTEVDARLSFDTQGSINKAHTFIQMYKELGVPRERVLIKLASTWEGALAARQLEEEGIHCNMTLLFSLPQAIICAEANATLISPFVGRILDWYLQNNKATSYTPAEDPGVKSVTEIYNYFKKFGYKTQVMGASFRNLGQITELAGCDLLTIAPKLLKELSSSSSPLTRKLDPENAKKQPLDRIELNESLFRFLMRENAMATDKLSDGIQRFTHDTLKLLELIKAKLG